MSRVFRGRHRVCAANSNALVECAAPVAAVGCAASGRTRLVVLAAFLLVLGAAAAHAGAGKKMYKEFVDEQQIYADERWQSYVQRIGARLLAHSPDAGKEYHFVVLDSDRVNAFATADAYIFVHRGLLTYLNSEDQLAAVIGHEIGHVVGRHMRKRRVTDIAGKAIGAAAAIATGRGELMRDVSNPLTSLLVAGYGRDMELEADRLGGEFMALAGYDPLAIIDTVWVLKDQQDFSRQVGGDAPTYHGLFASHPRNDQRLHQAVAYARSLSSPELREPEGVFWEMMDGIAYGDEAASGLAKEETYYHAGLRVVIEFPEGWAVVAQKSQVVGGAPGGPAKGTIAVVRHEFVKRKSPEEYVTEVLRRQDVINGTETEVNGAPAYVGEIDTSESSGELQLIAVVYLRQNVFLFKGVCGDQCVAEPFRAQFEETLKGLRPMTADDLQHANSRRIKVVVAEPGKSFADLAEQSPIPSHAADTLRLMNAHYPNGEPRAGDYLKIVQ